MTALERAAERGHTLERHPTVNDREQFVCRRCGATLLIDDVNRSGWGTSLDRSCLGSEVA